MFKTRLPAIILTAVGISFIGYVAAFLANILVARSLGAAGKGSFTLFQLTVGAVVTFSALGIGHGQMFHALKNPARFRHFLPNGYAVAATVSLLGLIGFLILRALNWHGVRVLSGTAQIAFVVAVPVISALVVQRQFLLALHSYRLSKANIALTQALPLAGYFLLFCTGRITLNTIIMVFVVSQVISVIAFHIMVSRRAPLHQSLSLHFATDSLQFGIQQYLSDIALFLTTRIDCFIVAALLGTTGLGVYSVAVGFAEICSRFPSELGTILFPAFAGGVLRDRAPSILRYSVAAAVVMALLLCSLAGVLLLGLFGQQYAQSITPFRLLLPGTVAWSTIYVTWNHASADGKPFLGIIIFGCSGIIEALLTLLLAPAYGINGAAIASSISQCLAAAAFLVYFCRSQRCTARDALLLRANECRRLRTLLDGIVPTYWKPAA